MTRAWLPRAAAAASAAIGAVALTGWVLGRPDLRSLFVHPPVTVKTNAALAMIVAGASLWLIASPHRTRVRVRLARALALLVSAIGGLTLAEHVTGWDLGIDQLLFPRYEKAGE